MSKLTINLNGYEMQRLRNEARRNLRDPHDQARMILRSVLLGTPTDGKNKLATVSVSEAGTGSEFATTT